MRVLIVGPSNVDTAGDEEEGNMTVKLRETMDHKPRVLWIDIFKAIAIVLMVLGHAGMFNSYIYQFHMAAFFFISGWTAKCSSKRLGRTLLQKFVSLWIPLFTMVILVGLLTSVLKRANIYSLFFEQDVPFSQQMRNFIQHGFTMDVLGTAWFVFALILVSVFSQAVYTLSGRNTANYLSVSLIAYVAGWFFLRGGSGTGPFGLYLVPIASGYYAAGYGVSRVFERWRLEDKPVSVWAVCFLLTSALMALLPRLIHEKCVVELASAQIHSLWGSSLATANGILWLISGAHLISYVKWPLLQKTMKLIGRNTFGIMLFHFLVFRLVSLVLAKLSMVSMDACRMLVPTGQAAPYWACYFVAGVLGSLLIWRLLSRIPVLASALGTDKKLYNVLEKGISSVEQRCLSSGKKWVGGRNYGQTALAALLILIAVVNMAMVYAGNGTKPAASQTLETTSGTIAASFPYGGNAIAFGNGWLQQSNDENYRWVRQESEFHVALSDQRHIEMMGYIPEIVNGVTEASLYLNGKLLKKISVTPNQDIYLLADIDRDDIVEGTDTFRLVFDGERIPGEQDADQRAFSAMFMSIRIE